MHWKSQSVSMPHRETSSRRGVILRQGLTTGEVDKCASFRRRSELCCVLVRLQVFRVTATQGGRERMENPVATARLILLLCRKVSTTKPLAAPPLGVLLRRGHAYPDRRSALTYPCPASPIPLPLPRAPSTTDRFKRKKNLKNPTGREPTGKTKIVSNYGDVDVRGELEVIDSHILCN